MQQTAQLAYLLIRLLIVKKFIVPRARPKRYGREDALIGQAAIKLDLHVTGSLILLKNEIVHSAAGLNQCGSENRQAAALFDITRSTEEPFWPVQGCGIEAARKGSTAGV